MAAPRIGWLCLPLLLTGCANTLLLERPEPSKHVTHDERYHLAYVPGALYRLKQAIRFSPVGGDNQGKKAGSLTLRPHAGPPSVVIPAETTLRVERLIRAYEAPPDEYHVFPIATMVDGPLAGRLVNLSAITGGRVLTKPGPPHEGRHVLIAVPNEKVIQRVEEQIGSQIEGPTVLPWWSMDAVVARELNRNCFGDPKVFLPTPTTTPTRRSD